MNSLANSKTVMKIEDLDFQPDKNGIPVAIIDWFNLSQAKVFRYPAGCHISLHHLSNEILLTVLKGKIQFEDIHGNIEIAESGMFRKCGNTPWITDVLEESYILVIEETDTEMIPENQQSEIVQMQLSVE